MREPTVEEVDNLLRKGADDRQNFVAWFMEKVICNLAPSLTFLVGLTRN